MGKWCLIEPNQSTQELQKYRAELVSFTVELARTVALPFGPGVALAIVEMFDDTIGSALANGADWPSGQGFVLSRVRMCGREAARLARVAGETSLTPSVLKAAWAHEIKRTHEAALQRLAATNSRAAQPL
jgi:hypothetical protein